ncbi:T9SS C-terminal target domain-containing protein [Formosa maritima]|uniref:T9SS C-terminal target domain-containing protein n=2 Tax=Formosa maritima TaxID=2592046 RepID=A0A5D0G4V8_9FLAO|nr:T9SS C-terminal target domain-containing protein [Formosa maritima]
MIKKLTYILFLVSMLCISQTYPVGENIMDITWKVYIQPSNTPKYLESFINEFDVQVTKISDLDIIREDSQKLRHHYSVDSPWNSDGSYIKLSGYPAAILNGSNYKFVKWANIPSSATWSNTNPNIMYGIKDNRLVSYNLTTNRNQTLYIFNEFEKISYGLNKGNTSYNDKYIGLIGVNDKDLTLIVFDIINNKIVGTNFIGRINIAWFSVSPLGNFAVSAFSEDGSEENQGLKVYQIDLTKKRHLTNFTTHSDLGIDAYGDEVYVAFGDSITRKKDYYMKMVRLSDGHTTPLFHYTEGYGVWGGHISCRNNLRPGYAYVSEGCCADDTIAGKEVFAIRLDDSNTIERYGYHHATYQDNYQQEPHAVPNRDGSKIMFASSWNGLFTTKYPPAFIVEKK